jgi:hypothetical protein
MVAERSNDRAASRRAFMERCSKAALVPPTVGLVLAAGEKPALAKNAYQQASRDAKRAAKQANKAAKQAAKDASDGDGKSTD